MFRLRTARLSCAWLALSIGPGFATVVTYSDITAWQNATAAGFTTINFDSFATSGVNTPYTTGLVIGDGTTFFGATGGTGQLWVYNQTPGPSNFFNFGTGAVLVGPQYNGGSFVPYFNITFATPVTSVGFNIMTQFGSNVSYTATLNGASSPVYTSTPTFGWSYPNPQIAFFGLTTTSDSPITRLILGLPPTALGVTPIIDNFSYGSAVSAPTDTPEACTLLLIGSGLVGMRLFRRRLRKPAEAVPPRAATATSYGRPLVTASMPTR
jgi:hypothetical protein